MRAATRVASYVGALAVAFAGAYGIGSVLDNPLGDPPPPAAHVGEPHPDPAVEDPAGDAAPPDPVDGLRVSADGYTLAAPDAPAGTAAAGTLRFAIIDPQGAPVTEFTESHEQLLHLIVVRTDTAHYQHVHPDLQPDGTWQIDWQWPAAGSYRLLADFQPAGHDRGLTLARTVEVAGDYQPSPPPAPATVARTGDLTVTVEGDLTPGATTTLTATVTRAGQPVTDLEPYLGAAGHLVALRSGDLAYLHVHPDDAPDGAAGRVAFQVQTPTPGTYRLFLEVQVAGQVHLAEFTMTTEAAS